MTAPVIQRFEAKRRDPTSQTAEPPAVKLLSDNLPEGITVGPGGIMIEESYQHQVLGTFSLSNQPTLGSSVALSFRGLRGRTGARASATPKFRSCG